MRVLGRGAGKNKVFETSLEFLTLEVDQLNERARRGGTICRQIVQVIDANK